MKDKWKSIFGHPLTIALLSGLIGGLVVFLLTSHLYYKPTLNLLQQQIQFNNAWEHYNGLRDAIHEKWYYMHSEDYGKQSFPPASIYDDKFKEISDNCSAIRETLRAKQWNESWELVETVYDMLKELPGPLWVEKQQ